MKNLKLALRKETVEVLSKITFSGGAGTGGFHTETVCTKYPCKDDKYTVNDATCNTCAAQSCNNVACLVSLNRCEFTGDMASCRCVPSVDICIIG